MFKLPYHLSEHQLDLLHYGKIFLLPRAQRWTQHPEAVLYVLREINCNYFKGIPLISVQFVVCQDLQVYFCYVGFSPVSSQPVLLHGNRPFQVQDFALLQSSTKANSVSPVFKPVYVTLNNSQALQHISYSP